MYTTNNFGTIMLTRDEYAWKHNIMALKGQVNYLTRNYGYLMTTYVICMHVCIL